MNLVGTDIMYMNLVGTGPSFDPSKIKELVFLRFLLQNLDGISPHVPICSTVHSKETLL